MKIYGVDIVGDISSKYITGSLNINGGITGSLLGIIESASYAATASLLLGAVQTSISSSYAATASLLLGSVESASYAQIASSASNLYNVIQSAITLQMTVGLNTSTFGMNNTRGYVDTRLPFFIGDYSDSGNKTKIYIHDSEQVVIISGSLNVSGGITGSLLGSIESASYALSASYAPTIPSGTYSYSNLDNIPSGIVSSSLQINTGSFSGSFKGDGSNLINLVTGSYSYNNLLAIPNGIVSNSLQINTGSFSGSFEGDGINLTGIISSSYALTASYYNGSVISSSFAENADTASYVVTSLTASYLEKSTVIAFACSDETTPLTASNAVGTFYMPYNFTVSNIKASLNSTGSAGSASIDIKKNNSTIFNSPLIISASTYTGSLVPFSQSFTEDNKISIDLLTVGSGLAGLKIYILGH